MMEPEKIRGKRFVTVKNGCNPAEVSAYLSQLADEIERLNRQNAESEEKIIKLVEKVNEYRDDEEAIKEAMVHAHKESNKLINDAKAKARDMIESAKTEQVRRAEMNAAECDKIIAEQKENCDRVVREQAEAARAEILAIQENCKAERDNYEQLKAEVTYFKQELTALYTEQLKLIMRMPEMSEEELDEYEEEYGEYYDDDEYYDDEEYYEEEEETAAADEKTAEQKHIDEVLNTASFEPIIHIPEDTTELRFGNNSEEKPR